MLLLLTIKCTFPFSLYLVRGNHESETVSTHFGFKEECNLKYGAVTYNAFLNVFNAMPIGALFETDDGTFFGVHGGISPSLSSLQEVRIPRSDEM